MFLRPYKDVLIRFSDGVCYCPHTPSGVLSFMGSSYDIDNWDLVHLSLSKARENQVREWLQFQAELSVAYEVRLVCWFYPFFVEKWTPARLLQTTLQLAGIPLYKKMDLQALYTHLSSMAR